jgi:hypothetical protein
MIAILNEQNRFYTYPEVAKILRCSEKTVYQEVGGPILINDPCGAREVWVD